MSRTRKNRNSNFTIVQTVDEGGGSSGQSGAVLNRLILDRLVDEAILSNGSVFLARMFAKTPFRLLTFGRSNVPRRGQRTRGSPN